MNRCQLKPANLARIAHFSWGQITRLAFLFTLLLPQSITLALPPPEEIPEEVLRTEIITEARSPVDGRPLTAAEYAELQAKLGPEANFQPRLNPELRQLLFLLRVRKLLRTVVPIGG